MCCFTEPVDDVSKTFIFARVEAGRQYLAYQMSLRFGVGFDEVETDPIGEEPETNPSDSRSAAGGLAMVLPVPLSVGGKFRFIDLTGSREMFNWLEEQFPDPWQLRSGEVVTLDAGDSFLEVERVGAYDASFVPTWSDFSRLDPRFRFKGPALEAMQRRYPDWSFAVFCLRPGAQNVQPMAFSFETRLGSRAFFPCLHVHDGHLRPSAAYDHVLYGQGDRFEEVAGTWGQDTGPGWKKSTSVWARKADQTLGIVQTGRPVARLAIVGERKNADVAV
jgi:hypothetical protein